MPRNYKLTSAAKNDVKDIWHYTVQKWGEQQAEKYIDQLGKRLKDLVKTPNLGRRRPDIHENYRILLLGSISFSIG